MTEGGGLSRIRSLSASVWWVRLSAWFLVALVSALSIYSFYCYRTMSGVKDQGLELEMLRSERVSSTRQLTAVRERLADLDLEVVRLKKHEDELKVLTRDFNLQLGLPETAKLAEVWPALINTVAWTWGGQPGRGGLDESESTMDYGARAVDVIKGLHRDLDRLTRQADSAELAVSELASALEGSRTLLSATPYALPMSSPRLTSTFGYRTSPFGGSRLDLHRGLDLASPVGSPVYAPADGLVLSAEWVSSGYGLMLTVDHGFGLVTRYAHLSESLVEAGQNVVRGQLIARVGNTGRSTGPHLHYETVLGGVPVNPFLFARSDLNQELDAEDD